MPKARSPNRNKAYEIYREKGGNITNKELAELLNESEKTISSWKNRDKWIAVNSKKDCSNNENTAKKRGGQKRNKNALKHGLFSRYLPTETMDIIEQSSQSNPLDLLWNSIQIHYAAIIRAQSIMYVIDKEDLTKEIKSSSTGDSSESVAYDIQYAWDKQALFLNSQSRAFSELRSLIKQYDELLHKNWELVTDEQKTRIEVMKSKIKNDKQSDDNVLEDMLKGIKDGI